MSKLFTSRSVVSQRHSDKRGLKPITQRGQQNVGRQILVIDDEPLLCQLIHDYLKPLGFRVLLAGSGRDGLRMARRHEVHAIILDINLGDMTGFDVIAILKRRVNTRDIPVIAFTGLAQEDERKAILAAGCNHYVRKPIHLSKLAAIVSRAASK